MAEGDIRLAAGEGDAVLANIGIALMALGAALVFGARLNEARRPQLERWGGNVFLVGIVTWALHWAI